MGGLGAANMIGSGQLLKGAGEIKALSGGISDVLQGAKESAPIVTQAMTAPAGAGVFSKLSNAAGWLGVATGGLKIGSAFYDMATSGPFGNTDLQAVDAVEGAADIGFNLAGIYGGPVGAAAAGEGYSVSLLAALYLSGDMEVWGGEPEPVGQDINRMEDAP